VPARDRERYDELRRAIAGRSLPLALLDLGALERNAQAMLARAGQLPIRLCSKSLRSVSVLRRLFALSPRFRGVLCYSAREAEFLGEQGFDDLLVAYPSVDAADLRAACQARARGSKITLMVDDVEQLGPIARAAHGFGVTLRVCIDLDLSSDFGALHFGVRRSPLSTPDAVVALARANAGQAGAIELVGLMGYEAQIAGPQDDVPGAKLKSLVLRKLKERSLAELRARRAAVLEALRAQGVKLEFVNGGGTGSLASTAADASVTEIAAGSGLYAPHLFDHFRGFAPEPALFFALAAQRRPRADIVTCGFGGYVASGPAGADRLPLPAYPRGMQLLALEGAGEVQTPVHLPDGVRVALGDPLFFRHAKAGELLERFERMLVVRDAEIVDEITSYRGDGKCFF
jgi:D-serine deaminase-like pyridoxal phosphate-dependent protein